MEKTYTTPAPIPKKIVFRGKGSPSFIKKQHPWHNISAFETIYKFRLKQWTKLTITKNTPMEKVRQHRTNSVVTSNNN